MEWLVTVMEGHPKLAVLFIAMGVLRAVFKPFFALLKAFADATPSPKDNELLLAAEKSKAYKAVAFALDWFASVKLPK